MAKKKRKNVLDDALQKALLVTIAFCLSAATYYITESHVAAPLPQSDQPPLIYSTPGRDDLAFTLSKAISEAKQSVLLIIYTLTDPKIIHALNEKSRSGIPVQVICDGKACAYVERKLDPHIQLLRRFGPCLMHQKILVVDKSQVWIGSANMTGESLRMHSNLVTAMVSPDLAAIVTEKADSFEEVGCNSKKISHRDYLMGNQKVEMWFLPDDRGAVNRIKSLIEGARKTIRVAMFTWTRRDFAEKLIEAYKRGIKVEVVLDYNSSQGSSANIMKFLIQRGIPVRLSQGEGLLHHKFMLVDDTTLVNGSANWTKAAFTQNDDCFIVIHDLNEEQRKQLDAIWSDIMKESAPSKYR